MQLFGVSFNSGAGVKIREYTLRMPTTSLYYYGCSERRARRFIHRRNSVAITYFLAGYTPRRWLCANHRRKVYSSRESIAEVSSPTANRFLRRSFFLSSIYRKRANDASSCGESEAQRGDAVGSPIAARGFLRN